jgi:hypothetical protein
MMTAIEEIKKEYHVIHLGTCRKNPLKLEKLMIWEKGSLLEEVKFLENKKGFDPDPKLRDRLHHLNIRDDCLQM